MLSAKIFGADRDGRASMKKILSVLEPMMSSDKVSSYNLETVRDMFDGVIDALILTGDGAGEKAIADAIDEAIISPRAEKILSKAQSIFLNIDASDESFTVMAVSDATSKIEEAAHPDAQIIWNVMKDETLGDKVRATLIIARLDGIDETMEESEPIGEFISDGEESALKKIHTDRAPAAVGPYSQAIEVNGFVFCSGQIAIDPTVGKIVATEIEGQADQCCRNVEAVLNAAGVEIKNVVKTTCFLADIADFKKFNAVYEKYFVGRPARSCMAVKDLPAGALCEIEVIAVK